MWPQFWGLRLQDNGLRFRWLVKPLLLSPGDLTDDQKSYYLDAQIYRMDSPDPYNDFTPINPGQAVEISAIYGEMITLFQSAETRMAALAAATKGEGISTWIEEQIVPVKWLRLFFATFGNQFSFHAIAEKNTLTPAHRAIIADEIRNTTETLRHLAEHPRSLIIATRGKWGQCFGPDVASDFGRKLMLLNNTHAS
jgi:hypothetical protein